MSVKTQINRLTAAKSAIATAIAGKGVTVPSSTKLDGMATLISEIPTQVNVSGLNAKIFDVTLDADQTSTVYMMRNNEWLKSLRNDPNGFVMMRYVDPPASTAMIQFWLTANFTIYTSGTTVYNSLIARSTASSAHTNGNTRGLPGDNYNCHLNIDANGSLWLIPSASYPAKAGDYQIIAGTVEMA